MGKIKAILQLLRVRQYYKSIIMFIGVFFSGSLFNWSIYPQLFLAFILVSLVSSLNYIHNDIMDVEKDKIHEEKRKSRPLASGALSIKTAIVLFVMIFCFEVYFIVKYFQDPATRGFALVLVVIYVNGLLYNLFLKQQAFADIISLSMIYIWRALAGIALTGITISPWLIIIVFLVAMILSTGKRMADLELLGEENASKHKKIYDVYSKQLLDYILVMIATSLFVAYTLYCILGPQEDNSIYPQDNEGLLTYSVPFALYLIIRYLYLIHAKPAIARDASKLILDRGFVIGIGLLALIALVALYFELGTRFWEILI